MLGKTLILTYAYSKTEHITDHSSFDCCRNVCASWTGSLLQFDCDMTSEVHPWKQIQAQCCQACQAMQGRWQELSRNAQRSVQQASESSQHMMQQVSSASAHHFQQLAVAANRRSNAPAFAVRELLSARACCSTTLLTVGHRAVYVAWRVHP